MRHLLVLWWFRYTPRCTSRDIGKLEISCEGSWVRPCRKTWWTSQSSIAVGISFWDSIYTRTLRSHKRRVCFKCGQKGYVFNLLCTTYCARYSRSILFRARKRPLRAGWAWSRRWMAQYVSLMLSLRSTVHGYKVRGSAQAPSTASNIFI